MSDPPYGKLPFRATCETCHTDLHCCRNCRFYKPGLPNDCAVPGTEFIPDRTANNLCEEFKLLESEVPKTGDPRDVARRLFGEENKADEKPDVDTPKSRFDNLFDD
jgi:hypothetical protein